MEEEMGTEIEMREMEEIKRAMAVDVMKEKVYPGPLHSHEDVVSNKALFMDSLRRFHSSMGTKFSTPVLGGKEIDLHLLYKEVTQRGGLDKVILEKRWKEIIASFSFPPTTTSASFVLRKYYLSLLHHYEQVYYFGAQGHPIPPSASSLTKTPKVKHERTPTTSDLMIKDSGGKKKEKPQQQNEEPSSFTVTGSIDGKFEYGYLVTVKIGPETLHGVLYHVVEQPGEASLSTPVLPPKRAAAADDTPTEGKRRRKRRWRRSDPAHPKPNRSAYNFYFAEQHAKLKALHPHKEKEFSKMIGVSWSGLSEEGKKVYRDRGEEDKERYRREKEEYREKQKLRQQSKEVADVQAE